MYAVSEMTYTVSSGTLNSTIIIIRAFVRRTMSASELNLRRHTIPYTVCVFDDVVVSHSWDRMTQAIQVGVLPSTTCLSVCVCLSLCVLVVTAVG